MELEFAPLEGVTDALYRRTHRAFYPGIDRYYTPFISPTKNRRFTPRELRELSPDNNRGVPLVPQLLGKNAGDFLWAAHALADMGYEEVNLNLGCPSGTVTAKGKGSGFLAHPDALDAFLDEVFAAAPVRVSIKTRLGLHDPMEFPQLLEIFNCYPISRLIIHPRTGAELYQGDVHLDFFRMAADGTDIPLCYNGNILSLEDFYRFTAAFPQIHTVMLGRGLVSDPAMAARLRGGAGDKHTLKKFHDALCEGYPALFGGTASAMHRMKAIWMYMLNAFQGGEAFRKKLIKAKRWEDFRVITEDIFCLELHAFSRNLSTSLRSSIS